MISIKWIMIYSTAILCFIFLNALYILGAARYITDSEENTCDMTYMFEYPQYVRISLPHNIEYNYPRFGLYAYGEGSVTEKLRRMRFSGIPVLFLPGNAGSFKQVRSIASVSVRKTLKNRLPFHFDFFTVSFNKDLSALYGAVLMEQTTYVSHCIKAILALYNGKMDNVVLIGHSMGGIIAKGALLLTPNINASFASMIINLATPHTPVFVPDVKFAHYYYKLKEHLKFIKDAGTTVVSIGGGPRDKHVTAAQTFDPTADINVLSTSVPAVWKSTDHLSILWCKQLVLAIVRSLFDSVDTEKLPRITSNPDLKLQALSYHLLRHSSGKKLYHCKEKVQFETDSEWINIVPQQYVWNNKNIFKRSSTIYLMTKLSDEFDFLTIDAVNLENKDWLFVCTASKKHKQRITCEWGWNLTNKTRILPDPLHQARRTVDLDLKKINYQGVTHVVVRVTPDDLDKHLKIRFDRYFYKSRVQSTNNKLMPFKYLFGFREFDYIKTVKGSVRYHIPLPNIMDAVAIEVKALNCINTKQHAIVELIESWNMGATQFIFFTNTDDRPKTMKIQTLYGRIDETANLRLTLDPECLYAISAQPGGIVDNISCRVRDRWPLLYIVITSLLLLLLSARIYRLPDFRPTIIVTVALSFTYNVIYEVCVALFIICLLAISVCFFAIFSGSFAKNILLPRLIGLDIAPILPGWITFDSWAYVIIIIGIYVTAISAYGATCIIIPLVLYLIKLGSMYEDYLEELLIAPLQNFDWFKRFKRTRSEESNTKQDVYDHLVQFLLWIFAIIPVVSSAVMWAKNFRYAKSLPAEDFILSTSEFILAITTMLSIKDYVSIRTVHHPLLLSNVIRLQGWVALSMTAAPYPFFYHCYMLPLVSFTMTFIFLDSPNIIF